MGRKNLSDNLKRFSSQKTSKSNTAANKKFPERYRLLSDAVGGELVYGGAGCYCLIKTVYPFGCSHGALRLSANSLSESHSLAAFFATENSSRVSSKSLLFLDMETTGLGGTGAVAFLVGLGRIAGQGFEVSQYLIPDYSDETAMLEDIYDELIKYSSLVSFNGASFDLPVLQDRMIMNRVARKLEFENHLDLLHPARRLFKRRLSDCTLTNLERQLFSFCRSDDIPGYLVPSVYFEWLGSQVLTNMNAVLEHNRLDILSLYFLLEMISGAYESEGQSLEHHLDLYSLSRYFERLKETEKVEVIFKRVKEEALSIPTEAELHFAQNLKRSRKVELSVEIWEKIANKNSADGYKACIELAKYYEHHAKNIKTALEYSNIAGRTESINLRQRFELDKRLNRIKKKLNKIGNN